MMKRRDRVHAPATATEIAALASPVRLRILRFTLDQPLTNKQIAERLRIDPSTSLYHVRRLVSAGMLAPLEPRPRPAGGIERPYLSTRRSWMVGIPQAQKPTSAMLEAFLAELDDAGGLDDAGRVRTVLNAERRAEFRARLGDLFDEYVHAHDPDGEPWAIFVAMYPDRS